MIDLQSVSGSFERIREEVGSLREALPCLFDALQEGFSFREGGVDLQGLLDGFDGRFPFFFRRVGPGEVVEDAFVVGGDGEGLFELRDGLFEVAFPAGLDAQGIVGLEDEAQEVLVRADEGPGLFVLPLVDEPHDHEGPVFLGLCPAGEVPGNILLGDADELPDEGQGRFVVVVLKRDGAEGVLEGAVRHQLLLKIVDRLAKLLLVGGEHPGDDHPLQDVLEAQQAGVDVSLDEKLPAVCQGPRNLGCPFSDDGFVHAAP